MDAYWTADDRTLGVIHRDALSNHWTLEHRGPTRTQVPRDLPRPGIVCDHYTRRLPNCAESSDVPS